MSPTMNLRFVEREVFTHTDEQGRQLPPGTARRVMLRVLQQAWVSRHGGEYEWRDVPLVAADAQQEQQGC